MEAPVHQQPIFGPVEVVNEVTVAGPLTDTELRASPVINTPVLQESLIGNIISGPVNRYRAFAHGGRSGVQNILVDLWDGPTASYVFPATPQQMSLVSSSANDTEAGTGARQVYIHYLDASYASQFEVVTLNGTTPVNTVATNILRINGIHAIVVGSGGVPAGNLSLTDTAGAVTYGYVAAGLNIGRQANFTVAAGHTLYVNLWHGYAGSTGERFTRIMLLATTHDGLIWPGTFILQDEIGAQNGGSSVNFPIPIPMPATTDIKLSAISDSNNANVSAVGSIMGWLE